MRIATLKLRSCDKCFRVFNRVIVEGSVFVTRPGSPTRLFQLATLMLNNVTAGGGNRSRNVPATPIAVVNWMILFRCKLHLLSRGLMWLTTSPRFFFKWPSENRNADREDDQGTRALLVFPFALSQIPRVLFN